MKQGLHQLEQKLSPFVNQFPCPQHGFSVVMVAESKEGKQ